VIRTRFNATLQCLALIRDPRHAEWVIQPEKQRFFMKQVNRNQLEQVSGGSGGKGLPPNNPLNAPLPPRLPASKPYP
jgi:hypothetical protein